MERVITIRTMIDADIRNVTTVHLKSFKGFFLSFLGPRFLNQLYRAIIENPKHIAFVAEQSDSIIGFVAGTIDAQSLYKNMLRKYLLQFAWASVGAVLKKPKILFRLLRALNMPKQEVAVPDCGTLMSIGVLPEEQGNGTGRMLIKAFLDEARKMGTNGILLTTDRLNNEKTNAFYLNYGFTLIRYYTTKEGRVINEYYISTEVDSGKNIAIPLSEFIQQ